MLRIADILLDQATRRVFVGDEERRLSPKAVAVLLALGETPRQVWSRDALLERVWAGLAVGEEVLTHAVAELRRAFGDDFRTPRVIETVHKSGYRLLAPIEAAEADSERKTTLSGRAAASIRLAAFAEYLSACEHFERGGRQNMLAAIALFNSVVRASPDFALAHAGLAKALTFQAIYYAPREGDLDGALAHCAAAHRLASGSTEAFAAQGLIFAIAGAVERSAECFHSALMRNPQSAETHYLLGRACLSELEFELAASMFERAARLRADDYQSLVLAGKMRESAGDLHRSRIDFALALPRINQTLAAYPEDLRALCAKARCLLHLGEAAQAAPVMEKISRHPDPMNYHLACTYARADLPRRALDVLEEVVELGWRHGAWLARDPDLDGLRGEARYKRIAAAL